MTKQELQKLMEDRAKLLTDMRKILTATKERGAVLAGDDKIKYEQMDADFEKMTETIDSAIKTGEAEARTTERERLISALQPDPGVLPVPQARAALVFDAEKRKAAFDSFLRTGLQGLTPEQRDGMTAGTDTAGGYLIAPLEIVDGILKSVDELVAFRGICDIKRLTSGAALGQATLDGDVDDFTWTTEIQSAPVDSGITIGRREMKPNAMRKLVKVSNKLMRMADPTAEIQQRLGYKIALAAEDAYMNGDGSGKPLGIFTAHADGIPTTRDQNVGAITDFDAETLIDAMFSLKDAHLTNAKWVMNKAILKRVRQFTDGDGRYLWLAANTPAAQDTILGYPVIKSSRAPIATTNGSYIAVFGNFNYYRIVEAVDMKITRLNELFQANAQIGVIGEYEGDGQPIMADAFTRLKVSA